MSVVAEIRQLFQEVVAPDLKALQSEVRGLSDRITSIDHRMDKLEQRMDKLEEGLNSRFDRFEDRVMNAVNHAINYAELRQRVGLIERSLPDENRKST